MSYCRWSSDNFRCDLYVYATDVSAYEIGWSINIARYRRVGPRLPSPMRYIMRWPSWAWLRYNKLAGFVLDRLTWLRPIRLPFAGESMVYTDRDDAAGFLEHLKELGYRFPFGIIDEIRNESVEEVQEDS